MTSTTSGTLAPKYAGLRDYGTTDYINVILQHLYMIPAVRQALLEVPISRPTGSDENGLDSFYEGHLLYQLQRVFDSMQESAGGCVEPLRFCKAVRMYGSQISLTRAEDPIVFFNSFVDQLQPYLIGTPQEHLVQEVFGGSFMHHIVSHECEHTVRTSEFFLSMFVKVANMHNLNNSLDHFVRHEMLDGHSKYLCLQCERPGRYVEAKKGCCIEHLPHILVIHLMRFEFSFETFENYKVFDWFEFPSLLDMFPYTREGLTQETRPEAEEIRSNHYYHYHLVGILNHSGGGPDSGHYHSYIKEPSVAGEATEAPKWFGFNDTNVSSFDPSCIPGACFGGVDKRHSANALFYERSNNYALWRALYSVISFCRYLLAHLDSP